MRQEPVSLAQGARSARTVLLSRRRRARAGFSYVEVLVATALIALCLTPALEALQSGLQGASVHESRAIGHYSLQGKLEELLAESFASLDAAATAAGSPTTPTSYSTSPLIVYIARYDGDDADGDGNPLTGGDDGLLWVRVEHESTGQFLQTLTGR
jgi:type II secretory pathway pseudopilin PulG